MKNTLKGITLFMMMFFCCVNVISLTALAIEIYLPEVARFGMVGMFVAVVIMGLVEEFEQ